MAQKFSTSAIRRIRVSSAITASSDKSRAPRVSRYRSLCTGRFDSATAFTLDMVRAPAEFSRLSIARSCSRGILPRRIRLRQRRKIFSMPKSAGSTPIQTAERIRPSPCLTCRSGFFNGLKGEVRQFRRAGQRIDTKGMSRISKRWFSLSTSRTNPSPFPWPIFRYPRRVEIFAHAGAASALIRATNR